MTDEMKKRVLDAEKRAFTLFEMAAQYMKEINKNAHINKEPLEDRDTSLLLHMMLGIHRDWLEKHIHKDKVRSLQIITQVLADEVLTKVKAMGGKNATD